MKRGRGAINQEAQCDCDDACNDFATCCLDFADFCDDAIKPSPTSVVDLDDMITIKPGPSDVDDIFTGVPGKLAKISILLLKIISQLFFSTKIRKENNDCRYS